MLASHWNVAGQVDGYMSKFWSLFIMPFILVGMFLLFLLIPKIDPKRANIAKFRKYFDNFIVLIIAFLFYLYVLTLAWDLNFRFNMIQFLSPGLAALFYYAGVLIEHSKQNWFIGIRTPWTLSSDRVWIKTHTLGGKLFKVCGVLSLFGIIFPALAIFFVFVPVLTIAVGVFAYSYFLYQKISK
jgi:uncharacterized membrane protein